MEIFRNILVGLLLQVMGMGLAIGQTCTGSLGDPIALITFGAGSNFGSPLPDGVTTNIGFVASECPNDGYYTIANSTSGCYGNSWITAKDHTGDPNGYFMLINASYAPSNFFIKRVDGLCPSTQYEFAAWLINMINFYGIQPDITFTIETTSGSILGQYSTGPIPVDGNGSWKQYGLTFATPADVTSVILRMRNNAPGGIGNDLGLDDISFRPAGPPIYVNIPNTTGTEIVLCSDDKQVFQFNSAVGPCYVSTVYQWQVSQDEGLNWKNIPGETGPVFVRQPVAQPGVYLYRLQAAQAGNIGVSNCQVASDPIKFVILDRPSPNLGPQRELCIGDSVLLDPGKFDNYLWQDGSTVPNFLVKSGGLYSVTVSNACETVSSSVLVQDKVCGYYFPTAFTPNMDNRNDSFKVISSYVPASYSLSVFNRWGQLVFQTSDYLKGWDGNFRGKVADAGFYIWTCEIREAGSGKNIRRKGKLTLIR